MSTTQPSTGSPTGSPTRPRAGLVSEADLVPVRRALLRLARAEAAARRAEARRRAAALVGDAQAEAEQARLSARASAEAEAAIVVDEACRRVQRGARTRDLDARRRAYEQLLARARAAVREAVADDEQVQAALEVLAHEQLGAGAVVTRLPDGGGVVASVDNRRVDYSIDALVEQEAAVVQAEREG